jgi:hypothetical protein
MSVAPEWRLLPLHRIPPRLNVPGAKGKNSDACWRMGEGPFQPSFIVEGLELNVDEPTHGTVGPCQAMHQDAYIALLIGTRDLWVIDEE